jgi:hypothetical protein
MLDGHGRCRIVLPTCGWRSRLYRVDQGCRWNRRWNPARSETAAPMSAKSSRQMVTVQVRREHRPRSCRYLKHDLRQALPLNGGTDDLPVGVGAFVAPPIERLVSR